MSTKRTITLSGRPPVSINEDNWPVIAKANAKDWDNEYEFQANRTSKWWIKVRQHEDGRALVYAGYDFDSNWRDDRNLSHRTGVLLDSHAVREASGDREDICNAISEVCDEISTMEHHAPDASQWDELKRKCIADMPAEEI